MKLETLLARTVAGHSTDLHLQAGERPRVRLRGELVALEDCPAPDADVLEHMLLEHVSDERRERLRAQGQLDFSLENVAEHQWRVHYFYEAGGLAAAFRPLPKVIPSLADLGLPVELERLVHVNSGLILLTGATGTGKTTTLAAVLELINRTYSKVVVTLEDPIEYRFENHRSIIVQREVRRDTPSFSQGARDAIRENPDVLVIGELRDGETLREALAAAESGMLVFATLHANDAVQTVDRMLDLYPEDSPTLARVLISQCLQAIVSQVLVQTTHGRGRRPACEVLFRTPAVAHLIRSGRSHELATVLQTGAGSGMRRRDDSLEELVEAELITAEEGLSHASDPGGFERREAIRGKLREDVHSERRHAERVEAQQLVEVSVLDDVGRRSVPFLVRTLDLSSGGLRVEIGRPVLIGSRLHLTLQLGAELIDAIATVRTVSNRDDGGFEAGLRFESLSDECRVLIEDAVARRK